MASSGLPRRLCPLGLLVLYVALDVVSAQQNDQESVSWEVSEYGVCSSPCGGGLQLRHVTCVRRISWATFSDTMKIRVDNSLCPKPPPLKSRSCNNHKCQAEWSPLEWSMCSTTCGLGTQTRKVYCSVSWTSRTYTLGGDRHLVSDSECGGPRPITSRACHLMDCPVMVDPDQPVILAENYTLWQLSKTRRLRANVGGELNLLPGQSVVLRCPVRYSSVEELIYWTKDRKLLSLYDHVTIKRADPARDAGTYVCTAQQDSANITINFIKRDNPVSGFYKKWRRKLKRRQRIMASKSSAERAFKPRRASQTRNHRKRGAVRSYRTGGGSSSSSSSSRREQQRDQSHHERHLRRGDNSRKRKKRDLTPTFVTGTWSKCNATCSTRGQRSRKVTCSQVTWKYAKVLQEDECFKAGLVKPNSTRQCFYRGRCAVWTPGPWTACRPNCGQVSYKSRYLVCQWSDTKELAWNACDPRRKPETFKPCKPKPCSQECLDKSRSCKRASHLRMCRYKTFRDQCCHSCKLHQNNRNRKSWRKTNMI